MGKKRIIAETGAGQHGVATATVCALFGLECVVYMGEEDMRRQRLNVFRMRLLGATVVGVTNGSRTLKDAISEAMRDWVTNVHTTHYLLGSALGAHPYPLMVRDFHRVIGDETRAEILKREGRLPDSIFACVGGGSNAIGMFHAFIGDENVQADRRRSRRPQPASSANTPRASRAALPACSTARNSYLLQDADGQVALTHSVSAGLDYVLIGPEHAWLHDRGRAEYTSVQRRRRARRGHEAGAHRRDHPGARIRARRCTRRIRRAPAGTRASCSSSIFPAAATKTPTSIAKTFRSWTLGNDADQTRIQKLFERTHKEGRAALIAYVTAGDPSPERTPEIVAALERGGVDLIELGVPFSDPIADGPVIQRAAARALKAGTTVVKVLDMARGDPQNVGDPDLCCSRI